MAILIPFVKNYQCQKERDKINLKYENMLMEVIESDIPQKTKDIRTKLIIRENEYEIHNSCR